MLRNASRFRHFVEYHKPRFSELLGPLAEVSFEEGCCLDYPHVRLSLSIDYRDGWIDPFLVPHGPSPADIWRHHAAFFHPIVESEFDPPSRGALLNDAHFEDLFEQVEPIAPLFVSASSASDAQRKAARNAKAGRR
ncbi:hypothetical protein AMC99_02381 [Altererythrobacter epoxidivorans]|uniref:Uncharacterized protein n=1 Tax=Altererythrobacter epoxidivorans TaxID=361183 RepID=A0A0M3TB08_9SPHN|nr:hypothetical protein [Altererythrobacter epoxidivorans]ALE17656.1 hypothetical protein AMC99_02381 [Altererythrobacter epoxidivorans]